MPKPPGIGGCPGGWIHIGDAGYLDDRGYLFMVDRLENMIITDEKNAYSA
jgi:acyl-CoA synthetase (AMP-forming)/AMP-acid ligase II